MESIFFSRFQITYKSQFQKMYPCDWFCGPGSHLFIHVLKGVFIVRYSTVQKFGVYKILIRYSHHGGIYYNFKKIISILKYN